MQICTKSNIIPLFGKFARSSKISIICAKILWFNLGGGLYNRKEHETSVKECPNILESRRTVLRIDYSLTRKPGHNKLMHQFCPKFASRAKDFAIVYYLDKV